MEQLALIAAAAAEESVEMSVVVEHVIMGAIAMASAIAALFFLRFWRDTGDRLFGMFALAFFLLGITRLGLALSQDYFEGHTYWYWVRFAAFVLILVAIADKNRR